ncbi:MAG: DUF4105 domain-containing protein, partial [Bacteroidales bacterium]|nr:DUF4105 domain-containing protein [Bacteroidales bacterium]
GHTAIRVKDDQYGMDKVYNFGTFDFSSPFFYIRFVKGNLNYFLSVSDFEEFYVNSIVEKRKIVEQVLDIPVNEKNSIYHNLEDCYHSEARFYRYNFFYDNCATRVRDFIDPLIADTTNFCCKSFRELIGPYLANSYWLNLGINLVLGKQADKQASSSDFMFLPSYIFDILNQSGTVISTSVLMKGEAKTKSRIPLNLAITGLVFLLFYSLSLIPLTRKVAYYLTHSVVAVTGILLLIISLVSENGAFEGNFNIFWTFPAFFMLILPKNIRMYAACVYVLILAVFFFAGTFIYAGFTPVFRPVLGLLLMQNAMLPSANPFHVSKTIENIKTTKNLEMVIIHKGNIILYLRE